MTKTFFSFLAAILLLTPSFVMAEDSGTVVATDAAVVRAEKVADEAGVLITDPADTDAPEIAPSIPQIPLEEAVPAIAEATAPIDAVPALPVEAPAVIAEPIPTDNLEFISGEISSTDETTQSVTVKLYGETESGTSDKTLKVTVDGTTDITDGEQDRDLKSLTAGTEVDVEYDPATNKATYIFVY